MITDADQVTIGARSGDTPPDVLFPPGSELPMVGGHLAVDATAGNPTAAFGRVDAVEVEPDGSHRVLLQTAELSDAFNHYQITRGFNAPDAMARGAGTSGLDLAAQIGRANCNTGTLSLRSEPSFEKLTVTPYFSGDLAIRKSEFRTGLTWNVDVREDAEVGGSVSCQLIGTPTSIPIPIYGLIFMDISAGINVEFGGALHFHDKVTITQKTGFKIGYDMGGPFSRPYLGMKPDYSTPSVTVDEFRVTKVSGRAEINFTADLSLLVADIVGVSGKVIPNIRWTADSARRCLASSYGVDLQGGAKLQVPFGLAKVEANLPAAELFSTPIGPKACLPSASPSPTTVTGTSGGGGTAGEANRKDTMFVIDTTGSMGGMITEARQRAAGLASRLLSDPGARVGLVEYRDHGDSFVARTIVDLTGDYSSFLLGLEGLSVDGGGDTPEAVYSGIVEALRAPWDPAAMRSVIVIGDAPAHDPESVTGYTAPQITSLLQGYGALPEAIPLAGARTAARDRDQKPLMDRNRMARTSETQSKTGLATTVNQVSAPDRPSVSLYGIAPYAGLASQLEPIALATKGTVVDMSASTNVGDAIEQALEDIENRPIAVLTSPAVVEIGKAFEVECSASSAPAGRASQTVALNGGEPIDCSGGTASVVAPEVGDHSIVLTLVDADGREAVAMVEVNAIEGSPGGTGSLATGSLSGSAIRLVEGSASGR
nr:VWA domain-containing protein [Dietzia maris]